MANSHFLNPHGMKSVRANLPEITAEIHKEGKSATPLIYGRYNKPEAVIISVEQYLALVDNFDDLITETDIANRVDNAPSDNDLELNSIEDVARTIFPDKKNG